MVEDSLFDVPNYDESRFETEILNPITRTDPQRSGGAYKVGTPATETSVSPMGAATWSMVFDMPTGVGGFTPTVGLAYSSQSGNGNAGWGVGISGISCISRGMKSLHFDGLVRGVKYDANDALFLDGRRLLLSSGTEGTTGAIYVPEGDPYTTVKILSSNTTTGPLSFEVTSPDGMVSQYGSTANARLYLTVNGYTRVHSWYISRVVDPHGNYADYTYMQDHLTVYPESITYGKNTHTGTGADNSIQFTYMDVPVSTVRTYVIGGTVSYTYGSNGLPSEVTACGSTTTMEYDEAGNRTLLSDPDAGETVSTYSADGKLLTQTDGRGIETVNTYDAQGRLIRSEIDTLVTTYTYGTTGYGYNRLVSRQTGSMTEEFSYDAYGRVTFWKRTFPDGVQSGQSYFYNSLGQLSGRIYPSNLSVTYTYDDNGFLDGIMAGNAYLWSINSYNGPTKVENFGNINITTCVNQAGQLTERYARYNGQTTNLHGMAFTWDGTRGNMLSRIGVAGAGVTETFSYDTLDRLTGVSMNGSTTDTLTYGSNGNIISRTGLGNYSYLSGRPHAVGGVENTGYMIASSSQEIRYNPLGKADLLREGQYAELLRYGPDAQRWVTTDSIGGQVSAVTHYHGDFEMRSTSTGGVSMYHYLGNGLLCVTIANSQPLYYYMMTDNVGSVVHVVNGKGISEFDAWYDAWGRQTLAANGIGFFRGYGGHEMLPQFRLVNMDGRMYDYVLGRFLSPDNYVQEPENSQSFNRYSYCLNNPLKYSDPDGDFFIGTIINGVKDLVVNTLVKVWTQGINAWTDGKNWHSTAMAFKIDMGLFRGSLMQLVSRFLWEYPQTVIGYDIATIQNTLYGVKSVSYYGGATAVETYAKEWGAFTLGCYIMGNRGLHADPNNTLFQHEYGHYLQSQSFGFFYIQRCGLPSLFDTMRSEDSKLKKPHKHHAVEQDANIRAYKYFHKHVKGYDIKISQSGWDLRANPINGYNKTLSYKDPINQAALGRKIGLGWADYVFGFSIFRPSIINTILLHQ